jgi:hypothetical protein
MSNVSAISSAVDAIGALNVATKITTVIGLAALAVIVAFLISSQWLSGRRAQIERAIERGDDDALAALLGHVDVPLDDLSREEKFALGREQSRQRFWSKMVWQALLFAAFLAVLGFAWALVQPKPPSAAREPISAATMTRMLLFVPEAERQAMCARTLEAGACAEIVHSIAGLSRSAPAKVEEQIAASLGKGTVTPQLSSALKGIRPVQLATGNAGGWDVSIRWCDGLFARRNEARAMATARALAQVPGERIAPGVMLGRITAVRTDEPIRTFAGTPGSGAVIAADQGAGEAAAAAAVLATLAARGIDHYRISAATARTRWRLEIFECASNVGVRVGQPL